MVKQDYVAELSQMSDELSNYRKTSMPTGQRVLALQRKVCSQFELPFKKDIPPGMQAYLRWFIQKEQD